MKIVKKRGTRPRNIIKIQWSPSFAYAIGLLVTDGCLYKDGRHMSLTTKDLEQARNFKKCLGLKVKIGFKGNGASKEKKYCHVQFGDVNFYKFLQSIGLSPAKSKTIKEVNVPQEFFFDYLRGCFDGDGTFYSYWDSRWKSSHMFYLHFLSASKHHIDWLREQLKSKLAVNGHINFPGNKVCYQLKYAKREAVVVIKKMYYNPDVVCLSRKHRKIQKALEVEKKQQKSYA